MLCKVHGFCGAMGNDASWVSVVDVCIGSLVRAQVGPRRGTEAILLHVHNMYARACMCGTAGPSGDGAREKDFLNKSGHIWF